MDKISNMCNAPRTSRTVEEYELSRIIQWLMRHETGEKRLLKLAKEQFRKLHELDIKKQYNLETTND